MPQRQNAFTSLNRNTGHHSELSSKVTNVVDPHLIEMSLARIWLKQGPVTSIEMTGMETRAEIGVVVVVT